LKNKEEAKNRGSFDLQPYQNFSLLFFIGRKLRPPGIRIEATGRTTATDSYKIGSSAN